MNNRMLMTRYVAVEVEQVYDKASKLGKTAARIFGRRSDRSRSQLTNLLNVANRANSPVKVISHIKNQAGKHHEWNQNRFAGDLLQVLEQDLKVAAERIDRKLSPPTEDSYELLEVHLKLIREFIIHLMSQYEYSRAENAEAQGAIGSGGNGPRGGNTHGKGPRGGGQSGSRGSAGAQDRHRGGSR